MRGPVGLGAAGWRRSADHDRRSLRELAPKRVTQEPCTSAVRGEASLADQDNCGVAGEPCALVVPAGAGVMAAPPVRPVLGVAGSGGAGGEQAGDLRDGQRDDPWVVRGAAGRA
jgi:hypothetical protein